MDINEVLIKELKKEAVERFGRDIPDDQIKAHVEKFQQDRKESKGEAQSLFEQAVKYIDDKFGDSPNKFTCYEHLALAFGIAALKSAYIMERMSGYPSVKSWRTYLDRHYEEALEMFKKEYDEERNNS